MKTLLLAALAAGTALVATPAFAQTNANFIGPRIEVNAGVDNVKNARDFNDVTYGLAAGVDLPLGGRGTLGGDLELSNPFDDNGRTLGAGVRLGYAVSPHVLAYGRAGYETVDLPNDNFQGLNVGGGLNFALNRNMYAAIEYRYTDFEHNVGSHGARVGIGLRF
jgi:outer membrane immunogenic protein